MKKHNAFTMVELIFSIAVMSFFMIALIFSVGKKAQQRVGEATSGRVICYKDSAGNLNKIVELDYGRSIQIDEENNVDSCRYELPANIRHFTIDVIGGGGGASGAAMPVVSYRNLNGSIVTPFNCIANGTPRMPDYYTKLFSGETTCRALNSTSPYFNPLLPQTDSSKVPAYMVNPAASIIRNEFSDIMDDATYNANMLKNITVSVAGGRGKNGEAPAMCKVTKDFAVGNSVSCYSGYDALENYKWNSEETYISPTSGQVVVNGQVLVSAQGGNFSECGQKDMFSSTPRCSAGSNGNSISASVSSDSYSYNAQVINSITLASGVPGNAGGYVRQENIELVDDINIRPEDVGNGGAAGAVGMAGENGGNGTAGGESCFVLNAKTRFCANGGAGGSFAGVQNINPSRNLIVNNRISSREHPNSSFISFEDGLRSSVSNYFTNVFFLMISAEQQQRYMGRAGQCRVDSNRLTCTDAQTSEEPSYGLGGSAAQSGVRYDYIKNFRLCNTKISQCQSTPEHAPEVAAGRGSNGNGGAIIVSW